MCKGQFIIYGQVGARDFGEGATYFWQVAEGGQLCLERKNLKKPAKPIFLRVSGKNKTKKFFQKNFPGGALIFGGLGKNIRPPPSAHK